MAEYITPLELACPATLLSMNARREGGAESRLLAVDLTLQVTTDSDVLLCFHPNLRLMLFDKDFKVRFPKLGKIDYAQEFKELLLRFSPGNLDELPFALVTLKKFTFLCKDGGKVVMTFQAQVRPSEGQFEALGRVLVQGDTKIDVRADQGDLFFDAARKRSWLPDQPMPKEPVPAASVDLDSVDVAPTAAAEPDPEPEPDLELNEGLLTFMKTAGGAEAKKDVEDRNMDMGFAQACGNAKLPKAFVDEHFSELQTAFTDGYDEELSRAEG